MKAKTEYQSVQIPKNLIEEIKAQISEFWYRSHHEFIIECVRMGLRKLIKTKYLLKKVTKEKNNENDQYKSNNELINEIDEATRRGV